MESNQKEVNINETEIQVNEEWENSWQPHPSFKLKKSVPSILLPAEVGTLYRAKRSLSGDWLSSSHKGEECSTFNSEVPSQINFTSKSNPALEFEDELSNQNLYKTELCRSWRDFRTCRYGSKCQFAHGEHELRALVRHPKYKTEHCKTYAAIGYCPYAHRCRFIHPDEKTVDTDHSSSPSSGAGNALPGIQNINWTNSWSSQGLSALTSVPPFIPKNRKPISKAHSTGSVDFSMDANISPIAFNFATMEELEEEANEQVEGKSRLAIFQTISEAN